MASTTPGTAVEQFDPSTSKFPVLFAAPGEGSVAEIIDDNFGDEGFSPFDLDRITVPAGGGLAWTIPDEEPSRFIDGVIVHKQPSRAFWVRARGEDGEDDSPPDCSSADGKVGLGMFGPTSEGNPSGLCAGCPMNQFGSSERGSGNGKACKEQIGLFMLTEGSVLPLQVSLPPTSLKPFRKYMTRLSAKGKSYYAVVTRLGLKVEKGGGQTYSVVVPERGAILAPAEAAAARQYGATIKGFIDEATKQREADAARAASNTVTGESAEVKEPAAAAS